MGTDKFDEPIEQDPGHADSPVVQSEADAEEGMRAEGCWYKGSKYSHGSRICWGSTISKCHNGNWVHTGEKC